MAPRMRERYQAEIVPALTKEFSFTTVMQVPRIEKIVLNIGLGEALSNAKSLEAAIGDLTAIAGQKPVTTRARKSIANFTLRQGQAIGAMVTLRGERMYEFLDRLIIAGAAAYPRLSRREPALVRRPRQLHRSACASNSRFPRSTTTRSTSCVAWRWRSSPPRATTTKGYALLKQFGMPFRD